MDRSDVTIQEVLREAIDARLLDVHTALPCTVLSYDPISERAKVRPGVRRALLDADDKPAFEALPDLPEIPVLCAAGLAPGDLVLLVFSEVDAQGWEDSGTVSNPRDVTRHGFSSPFAIPFPKPGAPLVVGNPLLAQFVANATLVSAQLDSLKAAIAGWTPVAADGGAALKTALTAWLALPSDVAATRLKAS